MRRTVLPACLVLLPALLLGACKTAPVYNVTNAPLGASAGSLEAVQKRIERAAHLQNWETEITSPGVMIVMKRKGSHVAAATIHYDTRSFSITLRNSANFKEGNGKIHKLYNAWVQGLERTIRQEVSAPS